MSVFVSQQCQTLPVEIQKKPASLIKSDSPPPLPPFDCFPSPLLSSPPTSLTLPGSPGLAWAGCAEVERLAG